MGRLGTTADDASIVKAVIGMAQSLRLRVVAEGVETMEQSEFLQDQACDEAQGYYFERPVAAPEFATLLRQGISVPSFHPAARSFAPLELA